MLVKSGFVIPSSSPWYTYGVPRSRWVHTGRSSLERRHSSRVEQSPKREFGRGWSWFDQNSAFQPPPAVIRSCQSRSSPLSRGMSGSASAHLSPPA